MTLASALTKGEVSLYRQDVAVEKTPNFLPKPYGFYPLIYVTVGKIVPEWILLSGMFTPGGVMAPHLSMGKV